MRRDQIDSWVRAYNGVFLEGHATGSRYICNPPPMDTDDDTVFLVSDFDLAHEILEGNGYHVPPEAGASMGDHEVWRSYRGNAVRNAQDNFIITTDVNHYDRFCMATQISKALNLQNKDDRIRMFTTILDMPYPVVEQAPVAENDRIDALLNEWGAFPLQWAQPMGAANNFAVQADAAQMLNAGAVAGNFDVQGDAIIGGRPAEFMFIDDVERAA
jgi:hypothetical protein